MTDLAPASPPLLPLDRGLGHLTPQDTLEGRSWAGPLEMGILGNDLRMVLSGIAKYQLHRLQATWFQVLSSIEWDYWLRINGSRTCSAGQKALFESGDGPLSLCETRAKWAVPPPKATTAE